MKNDFVKKIKRYPIIIIFLSIICLFLISFIPWITIAENDRIKEDLHFSYEMMKNSDNAQINDLADNLNHINILFFAMLILLLFFLIANNMGFLNDIAEEIAILLSGKKI